MLGVATAIKWKLGRHLWVLDHPGYHRGSSCPIDFICYHESCCRAVQVSRVKKNGDLRVDVLNKDAGRCRGSAASALSDLASMIGQPKKKE